MTRNLICSECGGTMQKGFITEDIGIWPRTYDASYWVEGITEFSFLGYLKTKGKKQYNIYAYRCERCGFMKFYAGPDHSSEK